MARDMEKLLTLDPAFEPKARAVIVDMEKLGWKIRVVWGLRTQAENDALVKLRRASKTSLHLTGRALDIIDTTLLYNVAPGDKYGADLAAIAKKYGLVWGGAFMGRWDPTHVEMPP